MAKSKLLMINDHLSQIAFCIRSSTTRATISSTKWLLDALFRNKNTLHGSVKPLDVFLNTLPHTILTQFKICCLCSAHYSKGIKPAQQDDFQWHLLSQTIQNFSTSSWWSSKATTVIVTLWYFQKCTTGTYGQKLLWSNMLPASVLWLLLFQEKLPLENDLGSFSSQHLYASLW